MPIDALKTVDIIEVMENFLARRRPPAHVRHQVDVAYKIENQSVIIYEIREAFLNPGGHIESPVAKVTWIKGSNRWKVYWQRASGNWDSYEPRPVVNTLKDFIELVEEDTHHCFWG